MGGFGATREPRSTRTCQWNGIEVLVKSGPSKQLFSVKARKCSSLGGLGLAREEGGGPIHSTSLQGMGSEKVATNKGGGTRDTGKISAQDDGWAAGRGGR